MGSDRPDVVVIGGGVAGCALAVRLAAAGLVVTVLEREIAYRDIVRGEAMVPWGYGEAVALGVADAIMETEGASVMTKTVPYDESLSVAEAQARPTDLSTSVPGVGGVIGIGHPELRESLATLATRAGALVVRGARNVIVEPGPDPVVRYEAADGARTLRCRLVVGADGKGSATRAALGVAMSSTSARVRLSGMLVDDGGLWERSEMASSVDGRNQYIVIPRGDNRMRLYVGRSVNDPEPLNGRTAGAMLLDAYRTPIFPGNGGLGESTPLGPCGTFPLNDAWVTEPVVPGVALIGDAAGWSNPIIAQGLSIALRDARVLADSLLDTSVWNPQTLAGYTQERAVRMSRLRFVSALADLLSGFGMPDRAARRARIGGLLRQRPELISAIKAIHVGPWAVPDESFAPDALTSLALA
ncbi:FAD-dependent oxidoreductase [Tomitella biformata]|uniref:FAD-dependent oxidoreductase n=1 Tax=Tomitella biformata TaxID=630403 RepID=UPI0004B95804|nr:NAD(P)/FAD-dependent oxidoreductase [Tomitella biformata]